MVQSGEVSEYEFGQGTVHATRREALVFQASGRVNFVYSNDSGIPLREGASVRAGELLASLDSRRSDAAAESAAAQLETANVVLRSAKETLDRAEELRKRGTGTQANVEAAQSAYDQALAGVRSAEAAIAEGQTSASDAQIIAPFDGIVSFINVRVGQYVSPQQFDPTNEASAARTAPISVIDPSSVEIIVDLPLFSGRKIQAGQRAFLMGQESMVALDSSDEVRESNLDKYLVAGEVAAVSPAVNPEDRSIRVRITSDAAQGKVIDGDFVTTWIEIARKDAEAIIPVNALFVRDNTEYVFVLNDDNTVNRREVRTGLFDPEGVEVISGLTTGDKVVTRGKSRLRDGDSVRPTLVGAAQ